MPTLGKPFVWLALASLPCAAQSIGRVTERQAVLTGGPVNGAGKCTIEVMVDVRAEVELEGDSALLRTQAGKPAQWTKLQCSAAMPPEPMGLRITKLNGRGRIKLTFNPVHGGPAVVQIDDPQEGSDSYAFELSWGGFKEDKALANLETDRAAKIEKDPEFDRQKKPEPSRGFVRPFEPEEAQRACEDAAIDRAIERIHSQAVAIRKSAFDTAPERNEWVIGTLETRRGKDWDVYGFACSVDFRARKTRSVDLTPMGARK